MIMAHRRGNKTASSAMVYLYNGQPKSRFLHYSGAVGGQCIIFAGYTEDFLSSKEELSSTVEVFDQYFEQWRQLKTTGSPPKGLYYGGCCSTMVTGDLYVYGGHDGGDYRGGLYKLTMNSEARQMEWSQLSVESSPNGPMRKAGCGMAYSISKKKLAIIGGLGIPHRPSQQGSTFVKNEGFTDGSGFTNEIHLFDTEACIWSSAPSFTGTRPPPCSEVSFTSIDDHQALLYGGYADDGEQCDLVSALYLIDFKTMAIITLQKSEGDSWPDERASHAACCLGFGSKQPQLLVTGGVDKHNKTLKDAWVFDVSSRKWKECSLPEGILPRRGHSTVAVDLAPGLTEVTVFAGSPQFDPKKTLADEVKVAETVILSFEFKSDSEEWRLVNVTSNSQRGNDERIRGKMEKIKCSARVAANSAIVEGASPGDKDEVQRLQEALMETQKRERGLQEEFEAIQIAQIKRECEIQEVEKRMEDAAEAARDRENELQWVVQTAKRETKQAQQRMKEAEKRMEIAERRKEEAVKTTERVRDQAHREIDIAQREKEVAQQRERIAREEAEREREQAQLNRRRAEEAEAEARELGMQWVVRRREIQLINVELGRGGWGTVTVANFRGIQVAAKCLFKDLSSDYYRDMFNREMNMAARLRHPNLVQFIGASIEGNPIILTELMKTSLRTELEKKNIKQNQVNFISLGVARALNYLHLMHPHPIVHRDVSSANVLLDPLPDNQWKAKVSDYGSVNPQQQLHTENPGSPVYSAPEANIPALQSPKMDVFSFGVLLVEMLTGRFPQPSCRQRLIAFIDHGGYLALIQQCLTEERDQRPSAQQLITSLSEINS